MGQEDLKIKAGEYAVDQFIKSGMLIGLGVGSTAIHAIRRIAVLIKDGTLKSITGVACSKSVEELAISLEIPLIDLKADTKIDVTIDGADEVDPQLNLIKGGGGALTREKIVAQISRKEVIVIDQSKYSNQLGAQWPVPIEVIPFGWKTQEKFLQSLGANPILRTNGQGNPFITDQFNFIIDADFGTIQEPFLLADQLKQRTGIVEHGLFIDLATDVIIANEEGIIHKTHET